MNLIKTKGPKRFMGQGNQGEEFLGRLLYGLIQTPMFANKYGGEKNGGKGGGTGPELRTSERRLKTENRGMTE